MTIDKLAVCTYDTRHMSRRVEVKSNLFPACRNCGAARNAGEDEINRQLTPDIDYTPPPKKSKINAVVTCSFDTGVEVPGSQIISVAKIKVNGQDWGEANGPIDACPGMYLHNQIPA